MLTRETSLTRREAQINKQYGPPMITIARLNALREEAQAVAYGRGADDGLATGDKVAASSMMSLGVYRDESEKPPAIL
jgi:hypothetical protein